MSRSATLAEIVADSIRQALRDGVYVCGERIAELTIAQEMNVSQNTARDALRLLEHEGWLMRRPRYGITVRAFDSTEAEELYTLRETLETLVLEWAMKSMNEDRQMHLSRIISEARIQAGMGNDRGVREAVAAFHETLVRIANRPLTASTLKPLLNQSRLLSNLRTHYDPDNRDQYARRLTDYGDLLTHIRYGDVDAAKTTLSDILQMECRQLLPVLDLVAR
ncbi:MAG: GntR family transcriptional regulator [Chloroflexota bacterium]